MIKPDAVSAGYTGKIIDLIESKGFSILALTKASLSKETAYLLYEIHKERSFFQEMLSFITSAPVVLLVLEKENGVAELRALMGATNPVEAAAGTIRNLYAKSIGENAVHGSDSLENAGREIEIMFGSITSFPPRV